jgi:hypothetical protein
MYECVRVGHNNRKALEASENKTCSTTHNRREYNPPPQTHMTIEGTYMLTT